MGTNGGYNAFKCKHCGKTNLDHGDWYWVTTACDCCSDCASGRGIVIVRGRYTKSSLRPDKQPVTVGSK